MSEKILLVPSASSVPQELQLDLGKIPTGMIPLTGSPTANFIVKENDSDESYITFSRYQSPELRLLDPNYNVLKIEDSSSLSETILRSLEKIPKEDLENSTLTINFADTLVEVGSEQVDEIYYSRASRTSRWTCFEENNREITRIAPRFSENSSGLDKVFVGVFKFSDTLSLESHLRSIPKKQESRFYEAVKAYSKEFQPEFVETKDWVDVGHLDTYHKAKKQFLNSRAFNETYFKEPNIFVKESSSSDRLKSEIDWYSKLPDRLKLYHPRIFELDPGNSRIEMEMVSDPCLSEYFLYGGHGMHIWENIFGSAFDLLEKFQNENTGRNDIEECLKEIYLRKTQRRLKRASENPQLSYFFSNDEILVNDIPCKSTGYILDNIMNDLKREGILEGAIPGVVHGDFHFGNLFYSARNDMLKVVDPRGSFGDFTVYGDSRYDLAKLAHSLWGKYDLVVNDLFNVNYDDESVKSAAYETQKHKRITKMFNEILRSNPYVEFKEIAILESLLYLSMTPLHSEKPERQMYMLSYGTQRYNDLVYQ